MEDSQINQYCQYKIRKNVTDEINRYDYDKSSSDPIGASSLIGINPVDGFRLGRKFDFLKRNFKSKPYTQAGFIFKTKIETKVLLSNDFEFYQGATIGVDLSLRGFRAKRFGGKQSFFQSFISNII